MLLDLCPQLGHHTLTVLEAALTLHVPERILLDLLIRCLLLEDIDKNGVGGVSANGVDDREAEFAFGEVFAEALEGRVAGCGGEVEVVV